MLASQHTELINKLLVPSSKFAIAEAKEIVDHIYDHVRIDTQDPFHNIFFYEICPLLLIAEHVGTEMTHIVFMGPDARFDGLIRLRENQRDQKVELTAAIDGYNDALQMELLRARGHAPAFQQIEATGTKRNRTFGSNVTEAIKSFDYDNETLLPFFRKALALKQEKAKRNQDYTGAWLGILFDDWIMPINERKTARFDPICKLALGNSPEVHIPFSRVFFIGVSRRYLFDSWQTLEHIHHLPDVDSSRSQPPTKS